MKNKLPRPKGRGIPSDKFVSDKIPTSSKCHFIPATSGGIFAFVKNKIIIGVVALVLMLVVGITFVSAFAPIGELKEARNGFLGVREDIREKREAAIAAVENNDYETWEELMNEKVEVMNEKIKAMKERINEENFAKLGEIHKLMKEGKYGEAREFKEKLGFGLGMGHKKFMGHGHNFNCNCDCAENAGE